MVLFSQKRRGEGEEEDCLGEEENSSSTRLPGMSLLESKDYTARICGLKEKSCDPKMVLIIVSSVNIL